MAQTKSFTKEELQTVIDQMDFMKDSPLKETLTTEIHLGNGTSAEIFSHKEGKVSVKFKILESANYFDR